MSDIIKETLEKECCEIKKDLEFLRSFLMRKNNKYTKNIENIIYLLSIELNETKEKGDII